jgi:hypothetical protein
MPPIPFHSVLAVEGVETSDKRIIEPGALTWRDLPLSLMAIIEDSHGGIPQTVSVNVGRIDAISRTNASGGSKLIDATGVFDDGDPVAVQIARKVADKFYRGVSIDVGDVESELEVTEEDEDGWPVDWLDHLTAGRIAMATVCGFPAFAEAFIEVTDVAVLEEAEQALVASGAEQPADVVAPQSQGEGWRLLALVAAAAPTEPPAEWFADPQLDAPTALTITDDGRVFGHLALWGTEHTAMPGMTPPRSRSGYAHFHVGAVRTNDGQDVAVGHLTLDTGHAPLRGITPTEALAHYDHTGTAWADVRAGEDAYGIWVAGACRPELSDEVLRAARSAPLSGDWRKLGGEWEMIAALSVNVPGFPVPRAMAASAGGECVALVAAGALAVRRRGHTTLRGVDIGSSVREAVSEALKPLAPIINRERREALRARMGSPAS